MSSKEIEIEVPSLSKGILGTLTIPKNPIGIVIFAHGSGSSRFSPRNQYVAKYLVQKSIATLLLDLLTQEEEGIDAITNSLRFDIPFLATRLIHAMHWIKENKETSCLKIGYFGASTGSAAALIAAANEPEHIFAIVSRGGRPDLAQDALSRVKAPTLLIVGGNDGIVVKLNEEAFAKLNCTKKLEIVPGASHLFEEPNALEAVAELAHTWFAKFLKKEFL